MPESRKTNQIIATSLDFIEEIPKLLASPELLVDPKLAISKSLALVAAKKIQRFTREYNQRVEKGELKESSQDSDSDKAEQSFINLMKSINEGIDENKFQALKSIFFSAISTDTTGKEVNESYTLLQVCNQLSGQEIMVLAKLHNYTLTKAQPTTSTQSMTDWKKNLCDDLGLVDPVIVTDICANLAKYKLINTRFQEGSGRMQLEAKILLTPLGYKLSAYMMKYSD